MIYWQVTMIDINDKSIVYMHIWLGGVGGYFAESKFSPIFCKTFYSSRLGTKGQSPSAPTILSLVNFTLRKQC